MPVMTRSKPRSASKWKSSSTKSTPVPWSRTRNRWLAPKRRPTPHCGCRLTFVRRTAPSRAIHFPAARRQQRICNWAEVYFLFGAREAGVQCSWCVAWPSYLPDACVGMLLPEPRNVSKSHMIQQQQAASLYLGALFDKNRTKRTVRYHPGSPHISKRANGDPWRQAGRG